MESRALSRECIFYDMVHEIQDTCIYNAFEDISKFTFFKEGHERSKCKASVFAEGDSRSTMLQQRYYTILQQIFRDSKFIDTARGKRGADFPVILFGGKTAIESEAPRSNTASLVDIHDPKLAELCRFEITPVESLPGSTGIKVVFGMLSRGTDGRLLIEDIHQAVVVKLDSMNASDDFITENSFVLAKGQMIDEVFHVAEITLPPVPVRSLCEGSVNTEGGPGDVTEESLTHLVGNPPSDATMAVVSGILLDDPLSLEKLNEMFTGFEEVDAIPSIYVLMGDFTSKKFNPYGGDSLRSFHKGFESLAQILSKHPQTLESSKIVIVPGVTKDPGAGILPQPPFSDSLLRGISSRFPNVVLASNPCRVRFYNKSVVLFNGSVLSQLRKSRIVGSSGDQTDDLKFARCILSQQHLTPGPARDRTVIWDHDFGLRLYPPPHAIFYSDPDLASYQETVTQETLFVAPPQFSHPERHFEFHLYIPSSNETSLSSLSEE